MNAHQRRVTKRKHVRQWQPGTRVIWVGQGEFEVYEGKPLRFYNGRCRVWIRRDGMRYGYAVYSRDLTKVPQ